MDLKREGTLAVCPTGQGPSRRMIDAIFRGHLHHGLGLKLWVNGGCDASQFS